MKMVTLFFAPLAVSSSLLLIDAASAESTADSRLTTEIRQEPIEGTAAVRDGAEEVKQETKQAWDTVKEGSKEAWRDTKSAFSEGVLEGKLAMAISLNKYLKPFKIDSDVQGNNAILEGQVSSEVEKELAGSIASGIDGIESVDNRLSVDATLAGSHYQQNAEKRDFSQFFSDASTTASIKTELLANDDIKGLKINVDTYNGRVTLNGEVQTEAQKSLAESIARKRDDVTEVVNRIRVNS